MPILLTVLQPGVLDMAQPLVGLGMSEPLKKNTVPLRETK